MARTPISDRPLVAQWLIESRKRFTNPATGRPWSAEHFLEELRASGGWAPNIANYAQWESGEVTPREENLRPVVAFYAGRGIAGPVQPPPQESPSDLAAASVRAAAAQAEATARLADAMERIADFLTSPRAGQADSPARALFEMLVGLQASRSGSPDPTGGLATTAGQ